MNCFSRASIETTTKFRSNSFALESLACSSDQFQKSYYGLLKKKTTVINLEEYGIFLRKCINYDVLPYKGDLSICSMPSHKKLSFVELYLADKDNEKNLEKAKKEYTEALTIELVSIDGSFHNTLMNKLEKCSIDMKKRVKYMYITELERLKEGSNTKETQKMHANSSFTHYARSKICSKDSLKDSGTDSSYGSMENSRTNNKTRPKEREINNSFTAVEYKKHVKPSQIRRLERRALERKKKADEHAIAQISVLLDSASLSSSKE